MKKLLSIFAMMMVSIAASAQEDVWENIQLNAEGAYEVKEVVIVEGVTQANLFGRAMEALSDWTGPDGRSTVGIDYSDKDAGTVIYKGQFYMGYYQTSLGSNINYYLNFTLKVRCKDGRAQTTVTSPSVTFKSSKIPDVTRTMTELLEAKKNGKKPNDRQKKRIHFIKVPDCVKMIVEAMNNRLKVTSSDDDF